MIRALLDTNVLISGFLASRLMTSTPGAIIRAWNEDQFQLAISPDIVEEFRHTILKPYFLAHSSAADLVSGLIAIEVRATIEHSLAVLEPIATHIEDDRILAAAVAASVDYLVTGDRQLQRLGQIEKIPIVPPRGFLKILAAAQS